MLPTTSDLDEFFNNFPTPVQLVEKERITFCNILDDIPAEKKPTSPPKRDKDMATFIQDIYEDIIMKTNLVETEEFENDQNRVSLRRRKLALSKNSGISQYGDIDNLEIFLFGVDESQKDKVCKIIGDTDIKKSSGSLDIKSCKTIHSVMKKCEKCRLIFWICTKDNKEILQLLVCTKVYPVTNEKLDPSESRKKVKRNSQPGEASSSGIDAASTDLVSQLDLAFANNSNTNSLQSASTTIQNNPIPHENSQPISQPKVIYKSRPAELAQMSQEDLIAKIIRLEGIIEDRDNTIASTHQHYNVKISEMALAHFNNLQELFQQINRLNKENCDLKCSLNPQDTIAHKQLYIEQFEDAKEVVNHQENLDLFDGETSDDVYNNLFN